MPIISMTANAMASDKEACLAAGMNDHVGKPIDIESLAATILRHCKQQGASLEPVTLETPVPPPPANEQTELAKALQRMGGNAALYQSMANSYGPTAESMHEQLQAHIGKGESIETVRVLHTLKGIARTMGSAELGDLAESEEKRIKQTGTLDSPVLDGATLLPLIRRHCDAARQFADSLHAQNLNNSEKRASITPVAQDSAAREEARHMLDELNQLLEGRNMRALALFGDFKARFGGALAHPLAPLEQQLDKLDFVQAQRELQALQENLS
jgi:CheY-like chemotaxis protein